MLASRFPCLINPPWRACIQFTITRNKFSASTRHELDGLKWTKLRTEPLTKAPASTVSAKAGESKKSIGNNGTTTGTTQSKKRWFFWKKPRRDKLPTSTTVKKNLGTKSKKTQPKKTQPKTPPKKRKKRNIPEVGPGLGVPEQVFDELIQTPINTPVFEIDSLGRRYELRYIDCKPDPMTARFVLIDQSLHITTNRGTTDIYIFTPGSTTQRLHLASMERFSIYLPQSQIASSHLTTA